MNKFALLIRYLNNPLLIARKDNLEQIKNDFLDVLIKLISANILKKRVSSFKVLVRTKACKNGVDHIKCEKRN